MPLDPAHDTPRTQPRHSTKPRPRTEECGKVLAFEAARRTHGLTHEEAAREVGVPLGTLRGWRARTVGRGLTPTQRAFFESPEGVQFLHVLVVAALFVMNLCGGLGVALVRVFFTLTGLHTLVACSETSLRRTRRAMLATTGEWGDAQDAVLAKAMTFKDILACVDENFHDHMMLVAMEPVSGFLLAETVADRRDGKTWAVTLQTALAKWPVRLVALVGDEAKGLIRCAKVWLGVAKGSDLFHVQHAICRGTAGALTRLVGRAETNLDAAHADLATADAARTRPTPCAMEETVRLAANVVVAADAVTRAEGAVAVAEAHRTTSRAAVRALGDRYHPVDLDTGAVLPPATVAARLHEGFAAIRTGVRAAGLASSRRVSEALAKAERVLPSLVAMVATWHRLASARIAALGLSATETTWVWATLLPVVYLDRIAPQGADREIRARLRGLRDTLVPAVLAADSPWTTWSPATRARVRAVVEHGVDLFVRTSSCVEGRNGQLALHHHRTHHLSGALLKALTVVHNYVLTRADGTTAAARFTGQKHGDLFQHLVAILPIPARGRVRRAKERLPLLATG